MMKFIIWFTWTITAVLFANAQDRSSGIYLTQRDFEKRQLSYSTNDPNETNKICFNELFGKPFITVKHNKEKIILFKDEIFAYQKKGHIIRSNHFMSYNFIEQGVIWIYFKDHTIALGKGIKRERKYYYAESAKHEIKLLTIYNLKKSFPAKQEFHNFLDAQFSRDSDLASYNGIEKKFHVNHLLETTIFKTGNAMP